MVQASFIVVNNDIFIPMGESVVQQEKNDSSGTRMNFWEHRLWSIAAS